MNFYKNLDWSFLRKKILQRNKKGKISCRTLRREKDILPAGFWKKFLLTRNYPPPFPSQKLNCQPLMSYWIGASCASPKVNSPHPLPPRQRKKGRKKTHTHTHTHTLFPGRCASTLEKIEYINRSGSKELKTHLKDSYCSNYNSWN